MHEPKSIIKTFSLENLFEAALTRAILSLPKVLIDE